MNNKFSYVVRFADYEVNFISSAVIPSNTKAYFRFRKIYGSYQLIESRLPNGKEIPFFGYVSIDGSVDIGTFKKLGVIDKVESETEVDVEKDSKDDEELPSMEAWHKTMEALHEFEPAPLNPDYKVDPLQVKDNEVLKRAKDLLDELPIDDSIKDVLESYMEVRLNAIRGRYSYSIDADGKITHTTERGRQTIDNSLANENFDASEFEKQWKRFSRRA